MSSVSFRDKIKAALVHSLHNDAGYGLSFIEKFKAFRDDLQLTEDWEMELAIREVYKGKMSFVWGYCEALDDHADPVASPEYEEHYDWCAEIQDLCLFIKNIEEYIE
jgi:hypothetical protein